MTEEKKDTEEKESEKKSEKSGKKYDGGDIPKSPKNSSSNK